MAILTSLLRLLRDRHGGVTLLGAVSLTGVVGMAAFGVEVSQGYAVKVHNQRIADAAALGAALAYRDKMIASNGTHMLAKVVVEPTARTIAAANGVAAANVTAPTPAEPTGTTEKVTTITVNVTTPVSLRLARVISTRTSYSVTSTAQARVTVPQVTTTTSSAPTDTVLPGCLYALSSTAATGIGVSGAAQVTATNCNVVSNRLIKVEGSAQVQAGEVTANGNIEAAWSTNIVGTQIIASGTFIDPRGAQNPGNPSIRAAPDASKKYSGRAVTVSDPFATSTALIAALDKTVVAANFPQPAALTDPSPVNSSTRNWQFSGSTGTGTGVSASWWNGSKWVIPAGSYELNRLTIDGSTVVEFAAAPNPAVTPNVVTIVGALSVSGTTRLSVLGTGNVWRVRGGVSIIGSGNGNALNGSGTWGAEFGDGSYHFAGATNFGKSTSFGAGAVTINGVTTIGGSVTFRMGAGNHAFTLLDIGGSSNVALGAGNLTIIDALAIGGSVTATIGEGNVAIGRRATGYTAQGGTVPAGTSIWVGGTTNLTFSGQNLGNTFTTAGGITQGCCTPFTFPAAANHFIGGTLSLNGEINFAPTSGSGTVTAGAYTVRGDISKSATQWMRGTNVSFFMSGNLTTSGASSANLKAPTGSTLDAGDALINILFASRTTAASTWNGSTQSTYTGMVYLPRSDVTVSGAGNVTGCFGIVALTITVNGSGAAATQCSNVGINGRTNQPTTTTTTSNGNPVIKLVR